MDQGKNKIQAGFDGEHQGGASGLHEDGTRSRSNVLPQNLIF